MATEPANNMTTHLPDTDTWVELPAEYDPLQLLSPATVARLLDVSRTTITRLHQSGSLPVVWVTPETPRIMRADLARWIENQRQ
jgi:excisionase family DNA binding protein